MALQTHWDGRFGSKVGQIGTQIGQIRDFFRSDFSTFGASAPNALKSNLKSPGFVRFGANLTHVVPKSGNHAVRPVVKGSREVRGAGRRVTSLVVFVH